MTKAADSRAAPTPEEAPSSLELASRTVLERAFVPVLLFDRDGALVYENAASRALFGTASEAPRTAVDFFAELRELGRLQAELEGAGPGGVTHRVTFRHITGTPIPVDAQVFSLDGVGELGTAVIAWDRRPIEALAERLEVTTRKLLEEERHIEQADRGQWIAHELAQPLSVAMGTLELLATTSSLDPPVLQRLERVYGQLQRVAQLVRTLSQPQAGIASVRKA